MSQLIFIFFCILNSIFFIYSSNLFIIVSHIFILYIYLFIYLLFSAIRHPPSAIRHPPSAIRHPPSIIRHPPRSVSLFQTSPSLVPRPVRAIRVTRGGLEPSAIARGFPGGTRLTFPDLRSFPYQSFMATAEHGHISDTCNGVIITLVDRRGNLVDIILYNDNSTLGSLSS